ncbi:TPA: DUF3883 domain-containing protein [Candidatus Poribacteria bacterium]|nr:DUF3883 domain-containing protein [Candidatus Poribacteria bacterium]
MIDFNTGDIVAGLEPDEHVEIRKVKSFGSKFLLEGVGVQSRREIRRPLSENELAQLVKVRGSDYSYDGDAEAFLLGVEAMRIQTAYQFDPLFAVNSSAVDILPHQIEAVYRYILPLPRIRFLLADDTGAGKTIMAGLLIKELLFRGVLDKVLIITPGGLTRQWQDEMQDKFGLNFRLINKASFDAEPGQFARDEGFFITSIDFISRNEVCLNSAVQTQWDMVIVDEAHKLSAYEYGTKLEKSGRYEAIEELSSRTDHLLFLTATPHRGRRDSFRRLLMILDPDLFQKDELVTKRIHDEVSNYIEGATEISNARNRFFLRRLKEEMVDWNDKPLFKPRYTNTSGYELTEAELELYNAVTRYVRSRRKEARARRNQYVELTLMVMQRRLASSIHAITRTLENRLNALKEVLQILRDSSRSETEKKRLIRDSGEDIPQDIFEYEDIDEVQRDEVDRRIFRQVLTDNPRDVKREIGEVAELHQMAQSLRHHTEAKFSELLKVLDNSDVMRSDEEKLIIFTEHKDTLDSLAERLTSFGYTVVTIHGGMAVEARKQAQREFRIRAKILVATDAAGEGINLQFCRYLINWDIPWNPNRLEQRMGRIHRYGQKDDVWVYNLVATNTREGKVLEKVLKKLDVMREQMGEDRVYDVVDELYEGVPLIQLIERSIDQEDTSLVERETEEYIRRISEGKARSLVELHSNRSLSSRLDLKSAKELRDISDENRLQPCFIQRFFRTAYQSAGGTITENHQFPVFHVGETPSAIMDVARQIGLPLAEKYDTPFVFDKDLVSVASPIRVPENTKLLAPGHPLFVAVIEWARRRAQDAFAKGATLVDPNIPQPYKFWLTRSTIEDGRHESKKRLAVVHEVTTERSEHEQLRLVVRDYTEPNETVLRAISPAYLLNCIAPDSPAELPALPFMSTDEIQLWAYEQITEPQLNEVKESRQQECELRRKYLNTTFTDLILELQDQLNDLQQAQLFGEDTTEEYDKLDERMKTLKERKLIRLKELEQMAKLSANLPEIITSAVVIPPPDAVEFARIQEPDEVSQGIPMRRDDEVERIAMEVAMQYEQNRGWTPYDVSMNGEHYDIRSESPIGEKRFIEVKGRAGTGAIVLTAPETDKLRQLDDRAFLYIVTFCKTEHPCLRIIQNPISHLTLEPLYRKIQYVVRQSTWAEHGEVIQAFG